jgi:hypothetical protein
MTTDPATGLKQRRDEHFEAIRGFLSADDLASAVSCAMRLRAEVPAGRPLPECVVLVAYGGGKDSSYTITFVRLMQPTFRTSSEVLSANFSASLLLGWQCGG